MRILSRLLNRVIATCVVISLCTVMARLHDPAHAAAGWVLLSAGSCTMVAMLLSHQELGKVGPINHVAGVVLPWGYVLGGGKLPWIVFESALRWVLIGLATIVLCAKWQRLYEHDGNGVVLMACLLMTWLVHGAAIFRFSTIVAVRARSSPMPPGLIVMLGAFALLLVASVALAVTASTPRGVKLALLIDDAPIALLSLVYLGLMVVMLIAGRRGHWH